MFQGWLRASALYADDDGIKWFAFMGMNLTVRRSSGHAESLDRAYDEVLHDLQTHWPDHRERKGQFIRTVQLWKLLDETLYRDPEMKLYYPVFDSVARSGKEWTIKIHARWPADLILDENFDVVSAKRIPDVKKE